MYPQNVIVVGAGPVGCTVALLLADRGIPVTVIERYPQPHPLPRAVHLDDEVARILHRVGVSDAFLAGSRPASGLRLLDARHRVMAEFGRDTDATDNGFPGANMFHQPDLEALLFDRVDRHPLVDVHRGVEVHAIDGARVPLTAAPVRVHTRAVADEAARTFTGSLVLGCDGANSTVRRLIGISMRDLRFNCATVRTRRTSSPPSAGCSNPGPAGPTSPGWRSPAARSTPSGPDSLPASRSGEPSCSATRPT